MRLVRPTVVLMVLLVTALANPLGARAQSTWIIQTLLPDTIAIRTPATNLDFAFDGSNFPPATFPATYAAASPAGGVMPVQVYSNASGIWSILLEVPDFQDQAGRVLVPASQVLYRVNGGLWLRASATPQIVYTHSGPTGGWLEIKVEFALELTGSEPAGDYQGSVTWTALRQY
jgi:hypothetical protein